MRQALTILSIFLSFNLFAADTVRIYDAANMVVTGFTNTGFTLGSDAPSGDATSETAPAKIYIPIQSGAGNLNYSSLNVTTLFDVGTSAHYVSYPLVATTSTTEKYIYAAVKYSSLGSSYFATARSTLIPTGQTNLSVSFNLSALDICKPITANGNTACSNLASGSVAEATIKPIVYFFLSSDVIDISGSTTVDPATYTGGVYFESQMSNRVFSSTDMVTQITDLKVGDGRLIIDFNSSAPMDTSVFKKVVVFNYTDTSVEKTGYPTYKSLAAAGSLFSNDVSTSQSGQLTLSGLTNNSTYNVSIGFLDKFLFVTTFSDSRIGTPLQIEELLKKQACFILTAGFGEEHYVTNFFRLYRDQVLAQSWLGKKFIGFYYKTAPHYALMIYRNEVIRSGIRGAAYALYFLFNYYWAILLLAAVAYFAAKKKLRNSLS